MQKKINKNGKYPQIIYTMYFMSESISYYQKEFLIIKSSDGSMHGWKKMYVFVPSTIRKIVTNELRVNF